MANFVGDFWFMKSLNALGLRLSLDRTIRKMILPIAYFMANQHGEFQFTGKVVPLPAAGP